MDLFVLVLCFCLGPLIQRWCDQIFCLDVGGNPLAAWRYADDCFLAAGAAWKLTRKLADLSAELSLQGLGDPEPRGSSEPTSRRALA